MIAFESETTRQGMPAATVLACGCLRIGPIGVAHEPRVRFKRSLYILFIASCIAGVAGAMESVLSVDPADSPLVIHGTLDGQTAVFAGNVRLAAVGAETRELLLLPSDLALIGNETVRIDRSNITIPSGITLVGGPPRDVRVTVNGITKPGEYTGNLKFILHGDHEGRALSIELTLHIDAKPKVQAVRPSMVFSLARTQSKIDEALAKLLLPESSVIDEGVFHLDNQTHAAVEISGATVVLSGEKTGQPTRPNVISLELPINLPANAISPIVVKVQRNLVSPDRYQGMLRLNVKGSDDPVTINTDFNLRDGPLWVVVVILFGILVGRLARGMPPPEAQKQARLLSRVHQLETRAEKARNVDARVCLAGQIREAKDQVASGKETEEVLSHMLDKRAGRIEFLITLEQLEHQLLSRDMLNSRLRAEIQEARCALIAADVEQSRLRREAVESQLRSIPPNETPAVDADHINSLREWFSKGTAEWLRTERAPQPSGPARGWGWLASAMSWVAGTETVSAGPANWLVRPLLYIILLITLALIGIQTLYVNAGSTFGVSGLLDYLGVFIWGLSADVAQRTLQNLPPIK